MASERDKMLKMTKPQLEEALGIYAGFITDLYNSAGLPIPTEGEEWNYNEESMIVYNAIKAIGRKEAITALLASEKGTEGKEALLERISIAKI